MKIRKYLPFFIVFALFPALLFVGAHVFVGAHYYAVMTVGALLSVAVFVVGLEKFESSATRLLLLSVLVALSVAGRLIFEPIPGFKPVTALVIIAGVYLGACPGFMAGALSALISNFFFSQGPWTPFQMYVWGLSGFFAGLLAPLLKKSLVALCGFAALSGVGFSLMMDVFTVCWYSGTFSFGEYAAAVASSGYFIAAYTVSNVVFVLLLARPLGKRIDRVMTKFRL